MRLEMSVFAHFRRNRGLPESFVASVVVSR